MRPRWLVFFSACLCPAVLACGGHPSPEVVVASERLQSGGVIYADLFVPGRQWQYTGTREAGFWDETDPDADETGEVTTTASWRFACEVSELRAFPGGGMVSRIDCDGDDEGTLEGIYAHSYGQLWQLSDWPDTETDLVELRGDKPIIAASPQPADRYREDEVGGEMVFVERDADGGWCAGETYWGGDEMGKTLCFAAGRGITSYSRSWAGGSWEEVTVDQVD